MKKIVLIFMLLGSAGCAGVDTYTGPVLPATVQSSERSYHRVAPGETLWKISRVYGVEIDDIIRLNHLTDSSVIEPGQALLIPAVSKREESPVRPAGEEFIWPLKGRIISTFGVNYHNLINKGINIQVAPGTDILAARGGKVVFYSTGLGNYGNTLIIDHGDGLRSVYSRIAENFVQPGDIVQKGALIGKAGSGCRDKNVYLHFEIRKGALPQNPLFYLPR